MNKKKRKNKDTSISLHPLSFEEAMKELTQAPKQKDSLCYYALPPFCSGVLQDQNLWLDPLPPHRLQRSKKRLHKIKHAISRGLTSKGQSAIFPPTSSAMVGWECPSTISY